ncbi:MAG TPA: hypothetical protein VK506_16620 [Conexibacter sp.]|nr:hypothetical protein [Conexibacter sp.]
MASRFVPVALLAALALALPACGAGDTSRERLQDSVRDALDSALERDGATTADAVTADCRSGGPRTRCDVGVTVDGIAVVDDYRVVVGSDGCWRAHRTALRTATGRDAGAPPHHALKGCVR